MEPERQLLLWCARTRPVAETLAEIGRLAALDLNWDEVAAEADRHRITPLVHLNLRRAGIGNAELLSSYHRIARDNLQTTIGAGKIAALLNAAGIPCVFLKGPVLAISSYGSCTLRQFDDLDLLVKKSDWERSAAILQSQGFYFSGDRIPSPGEDVFAEPSYYEIPLNSPDGLVVELHWALSGHLFRLIPDAGVWSRLRTVPSAGGDLNALPIEEELLFLCLHGTRHWWSRVSWICDVAEHIGAHPGLDWTRVLSLARSQGATRSVLLGFKLAQSLLDARLPAAVAAWIEGDKRLDRLAATLETRLFDPAHPLFDMQTSLRGPFYDFLLHDRLTDRVRLVWRRMPGLRRTPGDSSALMRPVRLIRTYVPQIWKFRKLQREKIRSGAVPQRKP